MGWTGIGYYPSNTRAFMRKQWEDSYDIIADNMAGSTYYAALRPKGSWTDSRDVFAAIVLTKKQSGEFLYKDMSEDMGPSNSFQASKSVLRALSDTNNVNAQTWRDKCWEYHRQKDSTAKRAPFGEGARVVYAPDGKEHVLNYGKLGQFSRFICTHRFIGRNKNKSLVFYPIGADDNKINQLVRVTRSLQKHLVTEFDFYNQKKPEPEPELERYEPAFEYEGVM